MEHALDWWLMYLRLFALNSPFGIPVKFTIGVTAYDGERVATYWRMKPREVVDAVGRSCLQVESVDKLIAIEWLKPKPAEPSSNPVTWGGASSDNHPNPRSQYRRTASGSLELKSKTD
jgi:hypothetical protein